MADVWRRAGSRYWWCSFNDWKGDRQRKSTRQADEKLAKQVARRLELEASLPRADPFTIGQALALAGHEQRRKGNSSLRDSLKRAEHIVRILGADTDLNASNIPTLGKRYMDARRKEQTPWGSSIRDSTIGKELGVLRQGMFEGRTEERFVGDPKALFPKSLKPGEKRDRWLPHHECQALLAQATPHRRRWLEVYLDTGLDVGELHRVKKSDVDWERGVFRVRGTKTRYRDREVPMTATVQRIFQERLSYAGEFVFAPVWRSHQVAQCMRRWCPRAGIEHVIVKDLRRTFCTRMMKAGVPELTVTRLMGHGSSQMIRDVYAQLDTEAFQVAVDALEAVPSLCQDNVVLLRKAEKDRDTAESETPKNAYEK
jgi:integrase